jgi:lysophospholipase L1-like esterase
MARNAMRRVPRPARLKPRSRLLRGLVCLAGITLHTAPVRAADLRAPDLHTTDLRAPNPHVPDAHAPAPDAAGECPPVHDLAVPLLPHTRAALATNQPILIVALGSSSTRGWMASDVGHSYPALLQRYLNDHVPHISVAVINRGIGGQDAPEELARLESDVLAVRPQLVIWQTGANGAVHDESPASFKKLMQAGITAMKAAGADVILMDNQRSPRILASADHVLLENAMKEIAQATGVNMFSRGAMMDEWAKDGVPNEDFIAADGMHMNNRGYSCLAETLGRTIEAALKQPIAQQGAGK